MSNIVESITVNVPAPVAYGHWPQLRSLPKVMDTGHEIEDDSNGATHWTIDIAGIIRRFEAEIRTAEADRRVAWTSVDGARHHGSVEFEPIDSTATRVTAQVEIDPEGLIERAADKLGVLNLRLKRDLQQFKDYLERSEDDHHDGH